MSNCNPMDCSMPCLPVHHQLLEFTQTHVHWAGDAIQSSHPLSSTSPPGFNQSIGFSTSAWVLPMNIQDWYPLGLFWSPCSARDSQGSSPTPQFKSISSLVLSFFYSPTLISIHDYWKNYSFDYTDLYLTLLAKVFHNTSPCFWFLFFLNTLSLTFVVLLDILYELILSSSAY